MELGWSGKKKDDRYVVFAERIATLEYLKQNLTKDFGLKKGAIQSFSGSDSDVEQQDIIEDFDYLQEDQLHPTASAQPLLLKKILPTIRKELSSS